MVLEIENKPEFLELRLRYYMAKMDAGKLAPKGKYMDMPKLYVTIVEKSGSLGKDIPRCFEHTIRTKKYRETEGAEIVDDGRLVVRINAGYRNPNDKSLLAQYIHDFNCLDWEKFEIHEVGDAFRAVKHDEGLVKKMLYDYQGLTDRILSEEEFMEAKKTGKEEERVEFLDELLESAWKNEDSNIIIPYLINNSRSRFQVNNEEYKKIVSGIAKKNGKMLPPNIDWSFGTDASNRKQSQKLV